MDEKTEELRDLFLDVTDEQTVTESQESTRGSLTDDGRPDDDRLQAVIEQLQEKFSFETDWTTDTYCELVRAFYDGKDDEEIAETLDRSPTAVFWARTDLHLLRDDDPAGDSLPDDARETISERADADSGTLGAELGIEQAAVERCRAVLAARDRSRRVSQRFQTEFEAILTDAALTGQFTTETQEDGLDEATEGAEVDVDF